jgi:hypothetical protein
MPRRRRRWRAASDQRAERDARVCCGAADHLEVVA